MLRGVDCVRHHRVTQGARHVTRPRPLASLRCFATQAVTPMFPGSSLPQSGEPTHCHFCRVLVCGAGVIGASVAYYLSLRGLKATVVEKTAVACAASGKAGGFLAKDWNDGSPTGPLARRSFELHEKLGDEFGDATGYRRVKTLSLKTSHAKEGRSAKRPDSARKALPAWLDGEIQTARTLADESSTAQVHPEKLTKKLMDEASKRGSRLLLGGVEGISTDGEGRAIGVTVDGREVAADVVVIALGPWTKFAAKWLPGIPQIAAQKAHSIVVQPSSPVTADCLFLDHRTKQGRQSDPEVYPRPDGTVYICGEAEPADPPQDPGTIQPNAGAASRLQDVGSAISSNLAEGSVLKEQACFLPLSPDGSPVIGEVPGSAGTLYVASGHSCWGILNGPASGEAVAAMIAGDEPPVEMSAFSPARLAQTRRTRSRSLA